MTLTYTENSILFYWSSSWRVKYKTILYSISTRSTTKHICTVEIVIDTETDVLTEKKLSSAICVQISDDSLNSAIHIAYRSSLRPSSLCEPRHPSLKVFITCFD